MSPLQQSPFGLLEQFNLRVLGRAPFLFGDSVQPTVDVGQHYLTASGITTLQAIEAPSATSTHAVVLPALTTATWLYAVHISLMSGANWAVTWFDAQIRLRASQSTPSVQIYGDDKNGWAWQGGPAVNYPLVGHQLVRGLFLPYPLLLPPGAVLEGFLFGSGGTAADASLSITAIVAQP
jgi:hypothetical protein